MSSWWMSVIFSKSPAAAVWWSELTTLQSLVLSIAALSYPVLHLQLFQFCSVHVCWCNITFVCVCAHVVEHRSSRRRILWRLVFRWQHQSCRDQTRPGGDDRLRAAFLLHWVRFLGNLPGELRRRRSHHDVLRRAQPPCGRGLRQNREGEKTGLGKHQDVINTHQERKSAQLIIRCMNNAVTKDPGPSAFCFS